ncbi:MULTISPECIES: alpha/beta fold hydrolase [Streptomyces]|uniref:alpha/beta fold hydrolase n=1 Tax=Streptomyces TaxID=1883 RepID=UPI001675B306|nr:MULTISPECIES: alpha/beta hydrolase [Streptomyces]MBD3575300.1 alpha/beta hydrolase [Streptomyces sp. KD18]GGS92163.1 alpha/beta hydrolase [Streptomyces toxytricini]
MKPLTFPRLTGAGLAACLAAGVAHQAYAELVTRTRRHAGFERRRVRCDSGNIITYHVRRGTPGGPTLVCEAGLMNTATSWLLLADFLDPSISVLVYDRAGYGSSLRRCPEDYSLKESVGDLLQVIADGVDTDGPCILAGHSLGGYIAHRAAAEAPDRVDGVVLVDPNHPRELIHSRKQREGARAANLTMKLGPWSATLGAGLLMDKKGMFAFAAGSPHHRALRLEGSAPSTWRAALREWNYSYAFMLDGGRPLDRLSTPVWVIAAESTVRDIPEHHDLYEEYVASGHGGSIITVPGSTHVSVTGGMEHAPHTAKAIEQAVADAAARRGEDDPNRREAA